MGEYRSELVAAQERIVALESELARTPQPPPAKHRFSAGRLLGMLVGFVTLGAMTSTCARVAFDARPGPPSEFVIGKPTEPPDPPRLRTGLAWIEDGATVGTQGERIVDLDGDGSRELVGLAWDRAVEEPGMGLHVVALDPQTLRAKWASPAFYGHRTREPTPVEHLVVLAHAVIVTDARGVAHTLDPKTGAQTREQALGFIASAACVAPDSPRRALFAREAIAWSPSPGPLVGMMSHELARIHNVTIDPASGALSPASIHTFCDWAEYCARGETSGCRSFEERNDAPVTPRLSIHAHEVWRDGDRRVLVGTPAFQETPGTVIQEVAAAGYDEKTRTVQWERVIAHHAAGAELPVLVTHLAFRDGTFAIADELAEGPVRLRAIDFSTGEQRFDVPLERSGIGTTVTAIFVDGSSIFVARSGGIERYDAQVGARVASGDLR